MRTDSLLATRCSLSMFEEVSEMSALVEIVLGGALLVLGRKLFW